MPHYRATIRYADGGQQYEVLDVEAEDLAEALRRAADAFPEAARRTGDLVEIRRQQDPDAREYAPG